MRCIVVVLLALVGAAPGYSQCDSVDQVRASDDTLFARDTDSTFDANYFILPNETAPYHGFDLQKDSIRFKYRIGEFALNSKWVYLNNWCREKSFNYDDEGDTARWDYTNSQLSDISRTKTFTVVGGDTLSFYREYFWLDHTTNTYNPAKFVSNDNVYVSVDLINAANGNRIALLDTIKISSTTTSKRPCVFGWKPAIARIAFKVPNSVDTVNAYMKVHVATSGEEGAVFMRYDMLRAGFSKSHLEDAGWQNYAKNVSENNDCTQSCQFSATPKTSPRRLEINVNSGQSQVDCVKIVDVYGNVINSTNLPNSNPYDVSISLAGVYIAAGYKDDSVACTSLVYVP